MKLNVKKFMKTEMGGELEDPDQGLGFRYWNNTCRSCRDRWEVFKLAIKQFYGIEFFFTRTDTYFGVCTEDETIWLMKIMR